MNLSQSLKISCDVYTVSLSGAPNNTETWTNDRTIKILYDSSKKIKNYTDRGVVIEADGMIYALYSSDFNETDRFVFNSKTYETVSLVDPNESGKESRIYVKRVQS